MKYELIEITTRASAAEFGLMPDPEINVFDALHPGQSAEEVAEAILTTAAEIHIAETRCW